MITISLHVTYGIYNEDVGGGGGEPRKCCVDEEKDRDEADSPRFIQLTHQQQPH